MGVITEAWETGTNLAKTIRDNAKRKKAQAIADAGGYNTLTPYQKALLGNYNPVSVDDVINKIDNVLVGSGVAPANVPINPLFIVIGFAAIILLIFIPRR